MPNYITNIVNMKGIKNKPIYDKDKNLDFNTLIPMSEELDVEAGGIEDIAIRECLRYVFSIVGYSFGMMSSQYTGMINDLKESELKDHKCIENSIKYNMVSSREDIIKLGLQYIQNVVKYGYPTWYDWCTNNWGTKWNAMDTHIVSNDEINFLTAWTPPDPIYLKLSEMYPYDEIHVTWVDEGDFDIHRSTFLDGDMIEDSTKTLIEKSDEESTKYNINHMIEYCNIRSVDPDPEFINEVLIDIRKKDPIRLIEKIDDDV